MVVFAAGNMNQNKMGVAEMLLHCSKCDQSSHPTCIGLSLDLIHVDISLVWRVSLNIALLVCHRLRVGVYRLQEVYELYQVRGRGQNALL